MPELWQEASPSMAGLMYPVGAGATLGNANKYVYWGTLANLPAPNTVPVNSVALLTDLGTVGFLEFFSDGAYWRPVGGRATIAKAHGRVANPLATISLNGSGQCFTLPAGNIKLPLAFLAYTDTGIKVEAEFVHHGTAGTVTARAGLSSSPSSIVGTVQGISMTAVEGSNAWILGELYIRGQITQFSHTFSTPNTVSGTAGNMADYAQNLNVDQYVTFGVLSGTAGTAPDTLDLVGYEVSLAG